MDAETNPQCGARGEPQAIQGDAEGSGLCSCCASAWGIAVGEEWPSLLSSQASPTVSFTGGESWARINLAWCYPRLIRRDEQSCRH